MADELDDIEAALQRQDDAMVLLERLRLAEPAAPAAAPIPGGGRRDFRRWPTPDGVTLELHNGERWRPTLCGDIGIGGARLTMVPTWLQGPAPARLKTAASLAVLVLADLVWRDGDAGGIKFEFGDPEERDEWTASLIDALLARYSLG